MLHGTRNRECGMKRFDRLIGLVCRDNRPGREHAGDRAFSALNNLKSLRVTPDGGISIEAVEISEQGITSRHALKRFVQ